MDYSEKIKQIPIMEYARELGFTVVSKGKKYCSIKEHDSVIIDIAKNCFWRNSEFQAGTKANGSAGSVIDFAIEFGGYKNAKDAMAALWSEYKNKYGMRSCVAANNAINSKKEAKKSELDLPRRASNDAEVFNYLVNKRKINQSVYRYFLRHGLLYQDLKNNVVFVGRKIDKPVFACLRSTGEQRFLLDCVGCDYNECFFIKGTSKTVIVTESVIETMSVMSLLAGQGKRYLDYSYLALAGTNKMAALYYHLKMGDAENVILALNNDEGGLAAIATASEELIKMGYNGRYKTKIPCVYLQDWNDVLKNI